jgi:predicted metal-dependent peptidase
MAKAAEDSFKGLDLLGPTDKAVDNTAREKLITARIGLLLKQAFFGSIAVRMKLINADDWCNTAATDGRTFYYNSRFVNMLRPKELEFLFGHEVLHAVYEHVGRCADGAYIPDLHNIACDYAVNQDLIESKVGEMITTVPCLYDAKFKGWSSEQIYKYLYDNAEKINMKDLLNKLLDEHMDGSEEGEGSGGNKPKLSRAEMQKIKDELREAVISAASQDAGNLPAGIRRLLKDLTEPQMDWREILRMNLESLVKSDFTWMRPSRKGWHVDAVLPGMKPGEMVKVAVAIDTSGSMTNEMIKDFLSEVKGIMESFNEYEIYVFTFDTQVYNPVKFTSENLEDIAEYDAQGGGGTDFECAFEHMKQEDLNPERFVMFTDMFPGGSWGDPNYCETLFVAHGGPNHPVAPFGMTVTYTDK